MNCKIIACVISFFSLVDNLHAALDSYTVTRTTGITYTDIVGGAGTAAVSSWRNSNLTDDNLSQTLNIGFTFYYDGSPHTQFRVSTNGFLTFNTASNANGSFQPACGDRDAYSGDNTTFSVAGTKGSVSVIAPFFDDLIVDGYALNSSMHYQVSGTAPNRVLTVQWRGMSKDGSCTSSCDYGNYNFQVKLFEATGNIQFIYGSMATGFDEDSKNYSCGLSAASAQLFTQQTANTATFGSSAVHTLSSIPQASSQITFARTAPAPASGVPTCINYHFPANNATNQCRNTTLAWSACDGVPTAFDIYFGTSATPPLSQADAAGNFYNPGSLAANTTYYWQVVPKNAFGSASVASIPVYVFTTGAGDAVTSIASTAGTTICAGASTTLNVNGTLSQGSVYNWTAPFFFNLGCKDNPPSPLIGDCALSSRTLTFNSAGTNRFDVFARGCNGTSSCQNITITVLQNSTAPTGISSLQGTTFCAGKSTTLTASGGTHASGAQYAWYTGSCGGTLVSVGTSSSITVTPAATTTYYVRREGTCPAATACFSVTLTVQNPGIGNNTIGNNQSICPGQLPVTINGSLPTGGNIFTYEWESSTTSSSAGFAPVSGSSNVQNYTPGALAATTWFRRLVTQVDGCSTSSTSNVVEIAVGSTQCDDSNPCTNDICNNGTCIFECTIQVSNVSSTNTSVQGCSDGTVSATVSHPACTGEWNALLFNGNTITKSWSSAQGATILWNNVPPGNYLIIATDFGDCSDSAQVSVGTQLPCSVQINNAQTTATSTVGCSDGIVSATVQAVVCNGEWFATLFNQANATVATWLSTQGNSIAWNNLPAGDYRIFVTDNKVCNAQQNVTVASGAPCSIQLLNPQTTVFDCDANSISATVAAVTCGNSWSAFLYNNDFSEVLLGWSSASGTTILWNDIALGDYNIVAADVSGCSDTLSVSLSCSDNDPCTNDFCIGGCNYAPKCNDGIACTQDVCQTGTCSFPPIICNDNNPCTIDICTGGNCVFNPRNCNDNNACTSDNCVGGVCVYTNICGGVTISGFVRTEVDSPVTGVTLYLSGSASDTFTTGANGFYSFNVAQGGSFTIMPVKANDVTTNNGVTSNDIALIRRHVLGTTYLNSPYKVIAADASNSGSVSTNDISLVRVVVLNDKAKFPPSNSRLWEFVNSDQIFPAPAPETPYNPFPFTKTRTYANLTTSQSNQNFIGVKIGDVNNSWNPAVP